MLFSVIGAEDLKRAMKLLGPVLCIESAEEITQVLEALAPGQPGISRSTFNTLPH
jgi:hypothetical protein